MRGLPGDSENEENPIMPNKRLQRTAIAAAEPSVTTDGYRRR